MNEAWPQLIDFTNPVIRRVLQNLRDVPVGKLAPAPEDVFNALHTTRPTDTKVLIIGQDPYIRGEAHGLAFSSLTKVTPSLRVIFKELARSGFPRKNPNLTDWAEQGVLLLNPILTTELGTSLAHKSFGWQEWTTSVVQYLVELEQPLVVMAWGQHARDFWKGVTRRITTDISHVKVFTACHPQAENYPGNGICFTGCNHFVEANEWLKLNGLNPIKWNDEQRTDNYGKIAEKEYI